jgi:hypothetical protein
MKLVVLSFALAFAWQSVHGRQLESPLLRGSDVEAVTAKDAKLSTSDGGDLFQEWRHLRRTPTTNTTCATTSVVVIMKSQNKTSTEVLSCDTAEGKHYIVRGVPKHVIKANKKGIVDGAIELTMPAGAYLDEDTATLEMPDPERLKLQENTKKGGNKSKEEDLFERSRRSLAVTGTRSALVVRIRASGVVTSKSEATLSNNVFGNGADGTFDPVTMRGHFLSCSHSQLDFRQANDRDGTTIQIRNGKWSILLVFIFHHKLHHTSSHASSAPPLLLLLHMLPTSGATTVSVSAAATANNDGAILNAAITEINAQFGVSSPSALANYILYFMPPGVLGGIAYAWVGGDSSVYGLDGWCVRILLSMVESCFQHFNGVAELQSHPCHNILFRQLFRRSPD